MQHRASGGILRSCDHIGGREAETRSDDFGPRDARNLEALESSAHGLFNGFSRGYLVGQHEVETAQDGPIQNGWYVRSRNNDRRSRILVKELKEGVEDAAGLPDVVSGASGCRQRVDFVEEVDSTCRTDRIENQPELLCGLPHELRDESVKEHGEERKMHLTCERSRGQRLAGTRRSGEQHTASRPQSLFLKLLRHPGFDDKLRDLVLKGRWKNDIAKPDRRIGGAEQAGEVASRRGERRWLDLAARWRLVSGLRPLPQLLGQAGMALLLLGCSQLHGEIEESTTVAFSVAFDEPYELLCGRHVTEPFDPLIALVTGRVCLAGFATAADKPPLASMTEVSLALKGCHRTLPERTRWSL